MEVLVHDPYLNGLPTGGAAVVDTFSELLARADFVSVHAR